MPGRAAMASVHSSRSVRADALIETIAGRQHGVVSRQQLLRAGITRDILDHRVATGRLRCVHRGVYQLGPLTSPGARFMAAVLACGAAAVLSGRSAAVLWQVLPPGERDAPVDVAVTRGGRLRRLLDGESRAGLTRSEAEERFVALVRKAGLRDPETNVRVAGGVEVDALWRAERLVVEIDGYAFHSSARRFERDRRGDAILVAAGQRVMRITWRQIVEEPEAVLIRVAQALVRT